MFTRQWLTVPEAAKYVCVRSERIRKAVDDGSLRAVKIDGKSTSVRVHTDDLDEWMYSMPSAEYDMFAV